MATSQNQSSLPASADSKLALGSVAIIGAGISGLAAAHRLKVEGVEVTVYESESTSGGKIKSFCNDGFIWEKGPNTMTESSLEVSNLIDELRLREKQQFPVMQSRRFIVRDGKPQLLPSNPLAFFGSKLLSAHAKFQILFEPFLWKRKESSHLSAPFNDESVGKFLERHVGREVVDYVVDPFVAGTSGSDPDSLSMRHAFPEVWALEKRYGSLLAGAIRSAFAKRKVAEEGLKLDQTEKRKKGPRGSFSFKGGMQTLTDALVESIGQDHMNFNSTILALACNQQGNPLRDSWKLTASAGKPMESHYDAVIMTAPVSDFKEMHISKDGKPYPLDFLPKIIYQPLSVVVTAFKKEDVKSPLDGFGVLVPSKEQRNGFHTLGTLFSSSMFPDRVPSNTVLFTTFIGGSRNRDAASWQTKELKDAAQKDLERLMGVEGQPVFLKHIYWNEAFPEYGPGYDDVFDSFKKLEADLPGFFYAGNHRGGLAVGKALVSGYDIAGQVIEYLQSSGGRKIFTMAHANT